MAGAVVDSVAEDLVAVVVSAEALAVVVTLVAEAPEAVGNLWLRP